MWWTLPVWGLMVHRVWRPCTTARCIITSPLEGIRRKTICHPLLAMWFNWKVWMVSNTPMSWVKWNNAMDAKRNQAEPRCVREHWLISWVTEGTMAQMSSSHHNFCSETRQRSDVRWELIITILNRVTDCLIRVLSPLFPSQLVESGKLCGI